MIPAVLKAYSIIVAVIIALDLLWLGVIMRAFYKTHLGHLLGETVVWGAAIVFYLVFATGIIYFAVIPGVSANSLAKAVLLGALLGAFAYATYDLTNHATLKNWPVIVTAVDIAWGTLLSAIVACVGWYALTFFQS